jgi:hypothetical protein
MRGQSAKRRLLILTHEAAIAEDIGTEYGGELTFQNLPPSKGLSCSVPKTVKAVQSEGADLIKPLRAGN